MVEHNLQKPMQSDIPDAHRKSSDVLLMEAVIIIVSHCSNE
jgi:hypothetical protein